MTEKKKTLNKSLASRQKFNFLKITKQTLKVDRRFYNKRSRKITLARLFRNLSPNLQKPIFLIGSPRSGTTFLGECLGKIPEVSYHFEPVATKFAANYVFTGEWNIHQSQRYYRIMYAWLMQQYLDGDLRFSEKTPRNCFLVDFLYQTFPHAQFIHIIRDGRDAALSHSKKPWMKATSVSSSSTNKFEPGGFQIGPYARFWVERERVAEFESTSDIHRCIWAWRRHTESALKAASRLPKNQYHELRYESLVTHPELEANRILDFLDIQQTTARTCFHNAVSDVKPSSVGRWHQELSDEDLQFVYREAKPVLEALNYLHA